MIRKLEVIRERLLSDYEPKEFKIGKTYFSKLAFETRTFLTENFRGTTNLTISNLREGRTDFSFEGYAYIIKVILNSIYGTCVAQIDICGIDKGISVTLSRECGEFNADEMEEIASVAKSSLIQTEISPKKIVLTFSESEDRRITFRQSLPDADILCAFVYVFFSARNKSSEGE